MAKKKLAEGELPSVFDMIQSIDKSAEIIADSAYSNIGEWIPTGSYVLNACMSGDLFGAIPTGRVTTFSGNAGCLPKNEEIEIYIIKDSIKSHDVVNLVQ